MIELRWYGNDLEYRVRYFQVDASGAFCGVSDFGPWIEVPRELKPSDWFRAAPEDGSK